MRILIVLFLSIAFSSAHANYSKNDLIRAKEEIVNISISNYLANKGNCPCPRFLDRSGRRCGKRAASYRRGGAEPKCRILDVSDAEAKRYLRSKRQAR